MSEGWRKIILSGVGRVLPYYARRVESLEDVPEELRREGLVWLVEDSKLLFVRTTRILMEERLPCILCLDPDISGRGSVWTLSLEVFEKAYEFGEEVDC